MEGLFLIFKFENGRFVLKQIIKCGTAFLLVLVLCLCLLPKLMMVHAKTFSQGGHENAVHRKREK